MRKERSPSRQHQHAHRALGAATAFALAIALGLPARSLGQEGTTPPVSAHLPSNADYARAMGAAQRAFNLHRWDDALPLFEQAHALKPNARTLRGMGACLVELHRNVEAAGYLSQALLDTRNPLTAEQRTSTANLLARASAAIGHVQLDLTPRDAQLFVDGQEVPSPAGGELALEPGHHELSAKAPGHELVIVQVEVSPGPNSVTMVLPALKPKPVFVVAAAVAAPLVAPPPEPVSPRRPLKVGLITSGAIVTAGGLASALATGLIAMKRSDELHADCPNHACPVSEEHTLDQARRLALVSNVMWGVTALGAGVCLLGILLPSGQDKRPVTASLQVGVGQLTLRGGF